MAQKKFIVSSFKKEENLFHAIEEIKKADKKIHNVYTPFHVHGLDVALGLRQTKLHTAGFIYGATGVTFALSFITWAYTCDWPVIFGGKPFWSLPAFVPILFEITVLSAAVGMTLTFCYLCQIAPFVKKHHFHPKATDDTFVVVMECVADEDETNLLTFAKKIGGEEVNIQQAEEKWWFGTY